MGLSDLAYRNARRIALALGFQSRSYPLRGSAERNSTPMHRAFYQNKGAVVNKWRQYPFITDIFLGFGTGKREYWKLALTAAAPCSYGANTLDRIPQSSESV